MLTDQQEKNSGYTECKRIGAVAQERVEICLYLNYFSTSLLHNFSDTVVFCLPSILFVANILSDVSDFGVLISVQDLSAPHCLCSHSHILSALIACELDLLNCLCTLWPI